MFGVKKQKSREYMVEAKVKTEENYQVGALKIIYEGAACYENRVLAALNDLPVRDAGLMIFVMSHVLEELKRQDPRAVCLQESLGKMLHLPPVKFRRKK